MLRWIHGSGCGTQKSNDIHEGHQLLVHLHDLVPEQGRGGFQLLGAVEVEWMCGGQKLGQDEQQDLEGKSLHTLTLAVSGSKRHIPSTHAPDGQSCQEEYLRSWDHTHSWEK